MALMARRYAMPVSGAAKRCGMAYSRALLSAAALTPPRDDAPLSAACRAAMPLPSERDA